MNCMDSIPNNIGKLKKLKPHFYNAGSYFIILVLLGSAVAVESKPLNVLSMMADGSSLLISSVGTFAKSIFEEATRIGSSITGLAGDAFDGVSTVAVAVPNTIISFVNDGSDSINNISEVVKTYYDENMQDAGKLTTDVMKSSLDMAKKGTNATQQLIADSLYRGLSTMESLGMAGARFSKDTLENNIGFLKDTGNILNKFTNSSLQSVMGNKEK